jgi:hypothetical protein
MRIKTAIGAFTAALAAIVVGLAPGVALAAPNLEEGLQLSERGVPVVPGAKVLSENFVLAGRCEQEAYGNVLNNEDPVDLVHVQPLAYNQCEPGDELSGQIRWIAFSDSGNALVVAQPGLTLTTSGGCSYEIGLLMGSLLVGGFNEGVETGAYVEGEATGFRTATSPSSCAHLLRTEFTVGEFGADEYLLNTELISRAPVSSSKAAAAKASSKEFPTPGYGRPASKCGKLLTRVVEAGGQEEPQLASIKRRGCHSS